MENWQEIIQLTAAFIAIGGFICRIWLFLKKHIEIHIDIKIK